LINNKIKLFLKNGLVEWLKMKALSSSPSTAKKKQKQKTTTTTKNGVGMGNGGIRWKLEGEKEPISFPVQETLS
jgi:hypothetical protein